MRIFGSESMNNILEKLGLKDGESIDHPWINKAMERAQKKVEARNFDLKNPDTQHLRYKQLMNSQYYNLQANTTNFNDPEGNIRDNYGGLYGETKKVYEIPQHFKLSEIQQKQR